MSIDQKKITILLPFFRDGGVERAMINLSQGLVDEGYAVEFVFMTKAEGPLKKEIPPQCTLFEINAKGILSSLLPMVRYLRKEKPRVLLSVLTPANILAVLAKKLSAVKVRTIVSVQVSVQTPLSTTPLKAKLRPLFSKFFYKQSDAIVAASKGVAEDLKTFAVPNSKITVIYNPVVPSDIEIKASEKVQDEWYENNTSPIILGAGRLHKQKDFPTLLKAFALVRKVQPARLVIIGEGEDRTMLEELARTLKIDHDTKFVGFVQNPYSYMRNSSVFVLSSAWEGFGNVVAEALAVGTPVVSTDGPWGPAEILDNGTYGKLVPVGDVHALARSIEEAVAEKTDSAVLINRAAQFSIPVITKQYLKVMQIN